MTYTFVECVKACQDPNDVPQLPGKFDEPITNADLQRDDWYVANMIRLKRRLVERGPVEPWEACKAWHEGKEVRRAESTWWMSTENDANGLPTFMPAGKWYIREPA